MNFLRDMLSGVLGMRPKPAPLNLPQALKSGGLTLDRPPASQEAVPFDTLMQDFRNGGLEKTTGEPLMMRQKMLPKLPYPVPMQHLQPVPRPAPERVVGGV